MTAARAVFYGVNYVLPAAVVVAYVAAWRLRDHKGGDAQRTDRHKVSKSVPRGGKYATTMSTPRGTINDAKGDG